MANIYIPSQEFQVYQEFQISQTVKSQEYIPFESNISPLDKKSKCEYCGKPDANANCHAHEHWCPYYCGNEPPIGIPIGDGLIIQIVLVLTYVVFKFFSLKKAK